MSNIDFHVEKNTDGIYDLVIEDGVLKEEPTLRTNILLSIFGEKRASDDEVTVPELRRGWWGNTLNAIPDYEIGSKLWLLEQARATEENQVFAENTIREGLQQLIDDSWADDFALTSALEGDGKIRIEVSYDTNELVSVDLF